MNEQFKKFTEELKNKLIEAIQSEETQKAINQIKDAGDSGTFEMVISTDVVDRAGESVKQDGLDITNYMKNPIVLLAHDYQSLPIGVTDSLTLEGNKYIAKGRFAPEEANPVAQQVRKLYDLGFIRTASVGFIIRESEGGNITKSELLEWSFVPVPCNPEALSLMKSKEIDVDLMKSKGLIIEAKEEEKKDDEPKDEKPKEAEPKQEELKVEEPKIETPQGEPKEEGKVIEIKEGRVLSDKNKTLIQNTINEMNKSIAALQELLNTTEAKSNDPQGNEPPKEEKERSKTQDGFDEEMKSLDDYIVLRQVLRVVNNATSNSLEKINQKMREKK